MSTAENREDGSLCEDVNIQNHGCGKCDFKTNVVLKWLQHTSRCTGTTESGIVPAQNGRHSSNFNQVSPRHWYYCSSCFYKTKFQRNLLRHIAKCHLYKCKPSDICPFRSIWKSALKMRINRVDEQKGEWHNCEKCLFGTKKKSDLTTHMKTIHLNDENFKRI